MLRIYDRCALSTFPSAIIDTLAVVLAVGDSDKGNNRGLLREVGSVGQTDTPAASASRMFLPTTMPPQKNFGDTRAVVVVLDS